MSPDHDVFPLGHEANSVDPEHFQRVMRAVSETMPDWCKWVAPPYEHSIPKQDAWWGGAKITTDNFGMWGFMTDKTSQGPFMAYADWADQNPQETYERLLTQGLVPELRPQTQFCVCSGNKGSPVYSTSFPNHRALLILALHTPQQWRTIEELCATFFAQERGVEPRELLWCVGGDNTHRHITSLHWNGDKNSKSATETHVRNLGVRVQTMDRHPDHLRVFAHLSTPVFLQ